MITKRQSILNILKNRIDITREPFSDRGSALLIYQEERGSRLSVRLARRFSPSISRVGPFHSRRPCMESLTLTDEQGTPLDFTLTTFPHALIFQTRIGTFRLLIHHQNTLALSLPPGTSCGLTLTVNPPLSPVPRPTKGANGLPTLHVSSTTELIKDQVRHKGDSFEVELVAPAGKAEMIQLTVRDAVENGGPQGSFSELLGEAEEGWQRWFESAPQVDGKYRDQYYYAWWVLGNNLIDPQGTLRYRGVMPSKAKYIGVWNWDACFHALALRHIDPGLARDQLRVILDHQQSNGLLPDVVHQDGVVSSIDHPFAAEVTKPPVMAWTALRLHQSHPDPDFLEEIYPKLVRWHDWWFSHADQGGLAQYHHPYSSGLDDNPLWDHGFPVTSPDINTYLVLQRESLGRICRILGDHGKSRDWAQKADHLTALLVEQLYSPERGYFLALQEGEPIPAFTPFNLFPLWTGRLKAKVQRRLLEHVRDEDLFWSPFPLATVAMNSPTFDPHTMWRGPVWININYLFVEALRRIGEDDLAGKLRERTLDLVNKNQGIYEYYHPHHGDPVQGAAPIFGWTAALFIDLLLEDEPQAAHQTQDGEGG